MTAMSESGVTENDARECKTYLRIVCDGDCAGLERELAVFGCSVERSGNKLAIGVNALFDIDVNKMLRVTLRGLIGKEKQLKALCLSYGARMYLEIVPYLVSGSDRPNQYLSLERDIIGFLYLAGAEMDLDYYVV